MRWRTSNHGWTRMEPKHHYYFCGFDTAPAQSARADDGAIVVLRATPRHEAEEGALSERADDYAESALYARKIRNASARQWSGFLHLLDERFGGFSMIVGDPGGGGLFIRKELGSSRQLIENAERECTPIVTPDDPNAPVVAKYTLRLFKRGDTGIESVWPKLAGDDVLNDAAHGALREAIEHGHVVLPPDAREWKRDQVAGWSEERQFALRNLSEMAAQLVNITVATKDDGTYAFTKHNVRMFSARGRKDLAYAFMYAHVAFLIWLRQVGQEEMYGGGDDSMTMSWWPSSGGRRR